MKTQVRYNQLRKESGEKSSQVIIRVIHDFYQFDQERKSAKGFMI
jgi:hypothetical protein